MTLISTLPEPRDGESPRLMVIMFTDVVESTNLKRKIGLDVYRSMKLRHDTILRESIASGRPIKDTGDGCLASFESVGQAIGAALLFQWRMAHEPWPHPFASRVGLHLGEVEAMRSGVTGEHDVLSSAIDLASRAMSLGCGQQILLTRAVFDAARQVVRKHPNVGEDVAVPALKWSAHGPYLFKGASDPIDIFEVGAVSVAPLTPPPDSEKAKRHIRPGDEATLGWRPATNRALEHAPNWVLIEKLGEGGFGEVWLARQAKSGAQRVYKFCFDADRLRALKREVVLFRLLKEALGDRRDIVAVRDWQFDKAPYFLELDHLTQGNLIQWAQSQGGIEKVPLSTRITIVAQLAEALAAAHSVGILHKDLKPSNVLIGVDVSGNFYPLLADFGIGILTDRSHLQRYAITEIGFTASNVSDNESSRTGTRMYSPPESLLNRPHTVQGDVYALGVMLYQLVIGDLQRPLAFGWERQIDDPLLRHDIAVAVEGDATRRLSSAAEFAEALRSIEDRRERIRLDEVARLEAEAARHATERLAAVARRRKRLLTSSSIIVGILLLAMVGVLFALRDMARQRTVALNAVQSEKLAEDAERQDLQNEKTITSMITNALVAPVTSGYNVTVLQVLKNIEPVLEDDAHKNLPIEVQDGVRLAAAQSFVAFHQWDDAIDEYRRALSFHAKSGAGDDINVADMDEGLAEAIGGKDPHANLSETCGLFSKACDIRERINGPNDAELGQLKSVLAMITMQTKDLARGEDMYLDSVRKFFGPTMTSQQFRNAIAATFAQVKYSIDHHDREGAVAVMRAAIQPVMANPVARGQLPDGVGQFAFYLLERGEEATAEGVALSALDLSTEIDGPDSVPHARILGYAGYLLVAHHRDEQDGLQMLRQAAQIGNAKLGPLHDDTITYEGLLMRALTLTHAQSESDQVRNRLLAQVQGNDQESKRNKARVLDILSAGILNDETSTSDEKLQAEQDLRAARSLIRDTDGVNNSLFFSISLHFSQILEQNQHFDEGGSVIRETLDTSRKQFGANDRRVGHLLFLLGSNLQAQGRLDEAVATYRHSCDVYTSSDGNTIDLIQPLSKMADAQIAMSQLTVAESSLTQLVQATERLYGPDRAETIDAQRRLAGITAKLHPIDGAAAYEKVLASGRKSLGEDNKLVKQIEQEMQSLNSKPAST